MSEKRIKAFFEFSPLVAFFVFYKFSHFLPEALTSSFKPAVIATIALIFMTILGFITMPILKIKQEKFAVYSNIALIFFGLLTIFFNDLVFIKFKITIINCIFAALLLYAFYNKKPVLKVMLGKALNLSDDDWVSLNMRFSFMFIIIAITNEVSWFLFSESSWVNFKIFFLPVFSMVYTALILYNILNSKKSLTK